MLLTSVGNSVTTAHTDDENYCTVTTSRNVVTSAHMPNELNVKKIVLNIQPISQEIKV
jgi:hypothetical protein